MKNNKNEKIIMGHIADFFDNKQDSLDELKEIIENLWNLKKHLGTLIDYDLLFELHTFFERDSKKVINLKTDSKSIYFDIVKRTIEIIDFTNEKKCIINMSSTKELSDELYDWICEFYFSNIKLNLENINESTEIETGLDFSGL